MISRVLRWVAPAAAMVLVLAWAAARRPPPPAALTETRLLMDTVVSVSLWGMGEDDARAVFDAAFAAVATVDREMARVPDSPLVRLNVAGGGEVSVATGEVLAASLAWARRTDGAFDPTTAPLLEAWDFLSGPHPPPTPEELSVAREQVGWQRVEFDAATRRVALGGTSLDLGGIAKGYAIDRAAEALHAVGAENFLVNAGGDLYLAGDKGGSPWRVGIQHPRRPNELFRVVTPETGAMVTSGDYERNFRWNGELYHHILDPRSGEPARGCRSVTVWAATAMDADALATAVFVLGPVVGLELVERTGDAEVLLMDAAGVARESSGFRRVAPEAPGR